jgi:hypothetical protein
MAYDIPTYRPFFLKIWKVSNPLGQKNWAGREAWEVGTVSSPSPDPPVYILR